MEYRDNDYSLFLLIWQKMNKLYLKNEYQISRIRKSTLLYFILVKASRIEIDCIDDL